MKLVGFTNMVFPNSWKLLEMLVKPTFSMICLWGIMELVGFTNMSNTFHDSRNYGLGPREVFPNSWKLLEMLVKPTLSMICLYGESWKLLVLPTFKAISMIPETTAQVPKFLQIHGNG